MRELYGFVARYFKLRYIQLHQIIIFVLCKNSGNKCCKVKSGKLKVLQSEILCKMTIVIVVEAQPVAQLIALYLATKFNCVPPENINNVFSLVIQHTKVVIIFTCGYINRESRSQLRGVAQGCTTLIIGTDDDWAGYCIGYEIQEIFREYDGALQVFKLSLRGEFQSDFEKSFESIQQHEYQPTNYTFYLELDRKYSTVLRQTVAKFIRPYPPPCGKSVLTVPSAIILLQIKATLDKTQQATKPTCKLSCEYTIVVQFVFHSVDHG